MMIRPVMLRLVNAAGIAVLIRSDEFDGFTAV
jgi:hypothetical protein